MEKDIGKIKKNDFTDIVIRIDDFGGRPGVTIREFVTGERYTGFTKAGVKIHAADFNKFKEMINSVDEDNLKVSETADVDQEKSKDSSKQKKDSNEESLDEMPDY